MRHLSANPAAIHRAAAQPKIDHPVDSLMPPLFAAVLKSGCRRRRGFVINLALPLRRVPGAATPASPLFAPNPFIRIDRQAPLTLAADGRMARHLHRHGDAAAEELDFGVDHVRLEHAPPNTRCIQFDSHIQTTGPLGLDPRLRDAVAPGGAGSPHAF